MGRNLRATRVHESAKLLLQNPNSLIFRDEVPPVWLKVVERYPPSAVLTRPIATVLHDPDPRQRRPRNLFVPQRIEYPEDTLRRAFFKDHPWELARPRIAVELDGKDGRYVDWSRGLKQPGWLVSGESVVQRQLWLMEHGEQETVQNQATGDMEVIDTKPLTREQAYDKVRKEFYAIRQKQDIQRRVAAEEARMVGAYFGKSRLEVGMQLEDQTFDRFKLWAHQQNEQANAARASAYANFNADRDTAAAELDVVDSEGEERVAPAVKPAAPRL